MIDSLNIVVKKQLESLDLSPRLIKNLSEYASLWALQLTPDIEAELSCRIKDKSDIQLSLVVTIDTRMREEAQNSFVMAMTQVVAPVTLLSTRNAVSTRLNVSTDLRSLNALLAESLLLTRYYAGPIFLGIYELQQKKRNLQQAIEETLKRLQASGQAQ